MGNIIILIIWLIGTITAYPKNKKWLKENSPTDEEWTNEDMITAIINCLLFWWFIWIFFIETKFSNRKKSKNNWWNKKSKF